jgi:hypothetical protein
MTVAGTAVVARRVPSHDTFLHDWDDRVSGVYRQFSWASRVTDRRASDPEIRDIEFQANRHTNDMI